MFDFCIAQQWSSGSVFIPEAETLCRATMCGIEECIKLQDISFTKFTFSEPQYYSIKNKQHIIKNWIGTSWRKLLFLEGNKIRVKVSGEYRV